MPHQESYLSLMLRCGICYETEAVPKGPFDDVPFFICAIWNMTALALEDLFTVPKEAIVSS